MCKKSLEKSLIIIVFLFSIFTPKVNAIEGINSGEKIIEQIKNEIISYFINVKGVVERVENGDVRIRIDNGVARPGMRLSVFRKGEAFHHPVTGELIGYAEEYIGKVEVKEINDDTREIKCRVLEGKISKGDKVRFSSSRIKVAFFQDREAEWALSERLYESLKNTNRFILINKYTPDYKIETLAKIARDSNTDVIMYLSTPFREGKRYINLQIYWADDASLIASIEREIGQEIRFLKPEEEFVLSPLQSAVPWGSFELEGGLLIAAGDVNGDDVRELVISDGHNIRIYSIEDDLKEIWHIKGKSSEEHLSIDVLDVNKNGIDEIFVTSISGDSAMSEEISDTGSSPGRIWLESYVLEYQSQGFRKIANKVRYFFRVIGNKLLIQEFDSARIFSRNVYYAEWRDGEYIPSSTVSLPEGVNIYGFTFVDWNGSGKYHILSFDDDGYLLLFDSDGNLLWKSKESFGKFEIELRKKKTIVNPKGTKPVRGRLFTIRSERGQEVIAISRIPFLRVVPGLGSKGARIFSLWWDGETMQKRVLLDEIPGMISDYLVEGNSVFLVARGNLFSFVKNVTRGEFKKGSMLYYYRFKE